MKSRRHGFAALAAALALAAPLAAPQPADAGGVTPSEIVQAEFLTGWRNADGTHMAALQLRLAEDWKTYWRSPGSAGLPPVFDWSGSENLADAALHWPRPVVFSQNGYRSVGYENMLILPIEFTPDDPDSPITISASIDIGVCKNICIPVTLRLNTELPLTAGRNSLIEAALSDRPETSAQAGVHSVDCSVEPVRDGLRVTAQIEMPAFDGSELAVFEYPDRSVWIAEVSSRRDLGHLTASAEFLTTTGAPVALNRSDITITVIGASRAVELRGCSSR